MNARTGGGVLWNIKIYEGDDVGVEYEGVAGLPCLNF